MQLLTNKKSSNNLFEIIDNKPLTENIYRISIFAPEIARNSKPGQFVSVLCDDMVLRRPFSIAKAENENITLIYAIKGEGTAYMAELKRGDQVNILGSLGKGFNITEQRSLLLGGGVGIAPMLFLSQILNKEKIPYSMLSGFRTEIFIDELNMTNSQIITDDGSSGLKGSVNDYLDSIVEKDKIEKIYTCGPNPVMKNAVEVANKYNIDIEVAMERKFACGVGVCMGCSIEILEDGQVVNRRICKDGPVFDGKAIIW